LRCWHLRSYVWHVSASLVGQLRADYKSVVKGLVVVAKVAARVPDQPEYPDQLQEHP
nr:hypothetical protein [Tanacetum cinerariifolium]